MKCGEGSARTISHLHLHLIPRKRGDRLWDGDKSRIVLDRTSGFERMETSCEELKATAKKIRGK
jgi:diadenosine tetraphosphate (Ap4A) HIT family hydrolase